MKKIIIQIILIIIVLGFIIAGITYLINKNNKKNELDAKYEELKNESVMYDESANIEELKEEYNMEGDSELYEIQTEYDGRKVLTVKSSENYKVAFAGLIKKAKPTLDEASQIFEEQYPTQNGIWIEPESREKILNYLNSELKSKYEIDENGYIKIAEYQKTNNDEILKNIIAGEKQYIIGISGITY